MKSDDGAVEPAPGGGLPVPALTATDHKLQAFTREWMQHQPSVRAYLASFLGNSIAVDDALQEVALVVWKKGPWDMGSSAFLGYSLACARRIALATSRKQADVRMELLSPDAAAMLADQVLFQEQEVVGATQELMRALRDCMGKIKPEHRELLESRYSDESKTELLGLSKRLGKSMDALYKTLERLRERLRACMERGQNTTG